MASLNRPRTTRFATSAELLGPGWEHWRGNWESSRRLVGLGDRWVLEDEGVELKTWSDLRLALMDLWTVRTARSVDPWVVGWLGYEACADLAGGLPVNGLDEGLPRGVLLVEPRRYRLSPSPPACPVKPSSRARWSLDAAAFQGAVSKIRERIAAGDVYQVNLSRRLTADAWPGTLAPFRETASVGGVPDYLAHFRFDEGELLTASMELLLRRRGDDLETRPIKGTRGRGSSRKQDRDLIAELDADPKERAELAMIVDLERNDLGRISEPGSIVVADAGSVHTYSSVHHRVARVKGRMLAGLDWWDALAAIVPGGSVTGCPKRAAMAVIAELEPLPRGPFTGALGVVGGNGDIEMALPIRSVWSMGGGLEFAAGCGIVWESDAAAEEAESRTKVSRWLELMERMA